MSLISEALSRLWLGASDSRSASRPEAPPSALGGRLPAGESPSANKEEKGSSAGPLIAYPKPLKDLPRA